MNFLPEEQGENFKVNLYDHGCGVAVADFDGDGLDDIYFLNQFGRNALYRNKGDGTFEDVATRAGVALGDRVCVGAAWADTRNNGRQDLYVTSTRGGNVFFRNNGDGTFTDDTEKAGLTHGRRTRKRPYSSTMTTTASSTCSSPIPPSGPSTSTTGPPLLPRRQRILENGRQPS